MAELHFFDRRQEFFVFERNLPHWAQAGTVCFLTYRTEDSMPKAVAQRWASERDALLRQHGIDSAGNWKGALQQLPPQIAASLKWKFTERFDQFLDECHGACVLKQPELAAIVGENLQHLDGQDYWLTDFVVITQYAHTRIGRTASVSRTIASKAS